MKAELGLRDLDQDRVHEWLDTSVLFGNLDMDVDVKMLPSKRGFIVDFAAFVVLFALVF